MRDELVGADFAGYRIEAVAGRGGMGVVYRARDHALGRTVALKVIAPELAPDERYRARFQRESRMAAALDHPNVLPIYAAGEHEGSLYLAMRYVEGTDLRRLLEDRGRLDPPEAARLVSQVAGALDAAHAEGLVHRDVKPANILLAEGVGGVHAYLADFGVARSAASGSGLTSTGQWIGTPDYAAPEQTDGKPVGPPADVYALGCVLLAAVTGRAPGRRPVPADVPPELAPVLDRALAEDPGARHPSAGALARAALTATGTEAPPDTLPAPTAVMGGRADTSPQPSPEVAARRRRRNGIAAVVTAVCLAGVVAAVATGALPGRSGGQADQGHPTPQPNLALPAPHAGAGVVRCTLSRGVCEQDGRRVRNPLEDTSCGSGSKWRRVDGHDGPTAILACEPGPASARLTMPDLRGARLDHAEQMLDGRDVHHHTEGGGLFGVVDDSNWTVCQTNPGAGAHLGAGADVALYVDRSC